MSVLALALALPLEFLARATSFIILFVFALVNVALVVTKVRSPRKAGFCVPNFVPVLGVLACLAMIGTRVPVAVGIL